MKKSQSNLNRNASMKKSQKVLGGVPKYNALPDRLYPVEITGESDGRRQGHFPDTNYGRFSASSKFDSETASEDSSTLKRKSMHLGSGLYKTDEFGIPIDVFHISVMSRTERIELRKRFIMELDQIKSISQKIENREIQLTSSGSVPTVSDGYHSRILQKDQTLSKDKRCVKTSQLPRVIEHISSNDKIQPAEKQKPKVCALTGVKRGPFGRFESREAKKQKIDLAQSNMIADQMKQCVNLLNKLMAHRFSSLFNEPVDPVKFNIPDYFDIIKNPMDLGTIKTRLETKYYSSPLDFAKDVRLTFSNATTYNPPGNSVHAMAVSLTKFFENKWKDIENKLAGEEVYRKITQSVQLIPNKKQPPSNKITELECKPPRTSNVKVSSYANSARAYSVPSEKKPKIESCKKPKAEPSKWVIPPEARAKIATDLELLAEEIPQHILDFLRNKNAINDAEGSQEVDLDLDVLDADGFWELQNLVSTCLRNNGQDVINNRAAVRPPDQSSDPKVESPQGCQTPKIAEEGADVGDEYVDVGGDEMPTTNFPTVTIEKDTAPSMKASSSSGSSSSDSDSSSSGASGSDSESSSSSDSESNEAEIQSLDAALKMERSQNIMENVESAAGSKQMGQSDPETTGAKRAVSVLDEEGAHPKTGSSDADAHQEGESAPPERQVSPDKLVRVALLKNRFADTILKAQEKQLNQVNKGDPEKLRREREQLEKWQREEKARLQAEAKQAEAVRKKAEAEAAAEAKRKIELEREAARQALQNMEKSVEIDHDNQILKDLERMGCAAPDHIPSSGDETSPVNSLDGLGNFPLQGKNPLERLGLYMKVDEEDEENTGDCDVGIGDVEEGEID